MSARIIIKRETGFLNGNGGVLKVFIDGTEVDNLINKTTFTVEAGTYAVQIKRSRNLAKTQTLIVNAAEGTEVTLKVKNNIKYYSLFNLLLVISLSVNLLFAFSEIQKPKWYSIIQLCIVLAFFLYILGYYLFNKGNVLTLAETSN